jgi:hypothetical protein
VLRGPRARRGQIPRVNLLAFHISDLRKNVIESRPGSRHSDMEPLSHRIATDRALIHLGRALAASALVAAWDRGVRLGVDEADDARCLPADGGLGNHWPAGVKLCGGKRHHGQRRSPI